MSCHVCHSSHRARLSRYGHGSGVGPNGFAVLPDTQHESPTVAAWRASCWASVAFCAALAESAAAWASCCWRSSPRGSVPFSASPRRRCASSLASSIDTLGQPPSARVNNLHLMRVSNCHAFPLPWSPASANPFYRHQAPEPLFLQTIYRLDFAILSNINQRLDC
jgi:hypothetical protein